MGKGIVTAISLVAVSCLAGGSYGGFVAGGYYEGQKMQMKAVAHSCGQYDPSTLEFSWRLSEDVGILMDAMPDIAPRKPVKGVK